MGASLAGLWGPVSITDPQTQASEAMAVLTSHFFVSLCYTHSHLYCLVLYGGRNLGELYKKILPRIC